MTFLKANLCLVSTELNLLQYLSGSDTRKDHVILCVFIRKKIALELKQAKSLTPNKSLHKMAARKIKSQRNSKIIFISLVSNAL
jgi:hypothetical protein